MFNTKNNQMHSSSTFFFFFFQMQIIKAIMLFPTIERMAQTPQGKIMTPVLCEMRYLAYLSVFLLSLLPAVLKASLIKLLLGGICSLDQTVVQPTVGLLSGDCAGGLCFVVYLCNACIVHFLLGISDSNME